MLYKTSLLHSINQELLIYVEQFETYFDIYFADKESELKIQIKKSIVGHYKRFNLDQNGQSISWEESTVPVRSAIPVTDYSRPSSPDKDPMAFIYGLANSINYTRNYRKISKPFSKNITGMWKSNEGYLDVRENGEYELSAGLQKERPFKDYPLKGNWEVSRGSFFGLVDGTGYRKLLVDVGENICRFIGSDNYLYYELHKEK